MHGALWGDSWYGLLLPPVRVEPCIDRKMEYTGASPTCGGGSARPNDTPPAVPDEIAGASRTRSRTDPEPRRGRDLARRLGGVKLLWAERGKVMREFAFGSPTRPKAVPALPPVMDATQQRPGLAHGTRQPERVSLRSARLGFDLMRYGRP